MVGVRIVQETRDGKKDFLNGEGRTPFFVQHIQANQALLINVGVVNFSNEGYLGTFEGVVIWE